MTANILIITQNFWPEKFGNASRIYDLSKFLIELGAKVTIISPHPTFPFGKFKKKYRIKTRETKEGIKIIRILAWQPCNNNPNFLDRMAYYLTFPIHALIWVLVERNNYSTVITTVPPIFTGITGIFIRKILQKKWILDVRDLWIDASISLGFLKKNGILEKISREYESLCYQNSDRITVTTKEIKKIIETKDKSLKKKLVVIPNGVDENKFRPDKKNKNKCLVYSGLLGTAQDLDKVLYAIKEVNRKHYLKFQIIGDGEKRSDLEKIVNDNSMDHLVNFTGLLNREEIPKEIAKSLIGIAPIKDLKSLHYAIPTKAYEYMSCGIPFIGMGKGEIGNLISDSKAGLLAENTIHSITENIFFLLENEEMIRKMGENGRKYILKNNTRRKSARKLLHIINGLQ